MDEQILWVSEVTIGRLGRPQFMGWLDINLIRIVFDVVDCVVYIR